MIDFFPLFIQRFSSRVTIYKEIFLASQGVLKMNEANGLFKPAVLHLGDTFSIHRHHLSF